MPAARSFKRKRRGRSFSACEGVARDMAHGGEAVIETVHGAVLARGALPGEHVRLHRIRRSGKALRGHVAEVLQPATERITPPCPIQERCGGCPWMIWHEQSRKNQRARWVREAVAPVASEPFRFEEEASPQETYRRRARLAWRTESGGGRLGYRAARSHAIVEMEQCLVLEEELQHTWQALRERLEGSLQGEGDIELLAAREGVHVLLRSEAPQPPQLYAALRTLADAPGIAAVAAWLGGASQPAKWGVESLTLPHPDGTPLRVPWGGFVQANAAVNDILVERVTQLAEPEDARLLELYAGHGNLTVALAAKARSLCAIETGVDAAEACRDNLHARGLSHARVVADDASMIPRGAFDVVVLDPPRAGAKEAIPGIVAIKPKRLIYVSCDVPTLKRDLQMLGKHGYRADVAVALDMFPQTAHVEAIVRLVRS